MIHIAFCCDNNYLPYCATVIASLIENNRDEEIFFHILCSNSTKENECKINSWISKKEKCNVAFYYINENEFSNFPIGDGYINISTYFRLALPELLPDVNKVLYLDCDVIVDGSIRELWNTDIRDCVIAGVLDRHSGSIRLYNRLDYPMEYGYVNAGVLLLNLKKMREEDLFIKARELAQKMPTKLKNHDQDILNTLYFNKKLILDFKYNLLEYYLFVEDWLYMDRKYYPDIIKACKKPVIIHFCLPVKPWHYECTNPFKTLYYKYRAMTPWPEVKLIHRKEKLTPKLKIKRILGKLGLYHIETKTTLRKDINVIEEPDNVLF